MFIVVICLSPCIHICMSISLLEQAFDYIAVIEVKNGSHFFVSITGSLNFDEFFGEMSSVPVTVSASGARGRAVHLSSPHKAADSDMAGMSGSGSGGELDSMLSSPASSVHNSSRSLTAELSDHIYHSNHNLSSGENRAQRSGSILFGGEALTLPPLRSGMTDSSGGGVHGTPDRRSRASSLSSVVGTNGVGVGGGIRSRYACI